MHQSVLEEIQFWNQSIAHHGAINEGRFFDLLMDVHSEVAQFLNADQEDVTILDNSSLNLNIVAMMLKEESKRDIVLVADEFPSNVLPFYHHGFNVIQVATKDGQFKTSDLEEAITSNTAAVICSIVQFATGHYTCPLELSQMCEEKSVHLILNATQSLAVFPMDLKKVKASVVTASCHKWLGAGIGGAILYLSKEFRAGKANPIAGWCSVKEPFDMKNEKPIPRDDVMSLQVGSLPFPVLAGVAAACRHWKKVGIEKVHARIMELSNHLRSELLKRDLIPLGNGLSGIVTFSVGKSLEETSELVQKMEEEKIYVNCRRGLIRVSPHYFNSEKDINALLTFLDKNLGLIP